MDISASFTAPTLFAPEASLFPSSPASGESLGIKLDRRLPFSILRAPILDLLLPLLLVIPRGVSGPRRAGLPCNVWRVLPFGTRSKVRPLLLLADDESSGVGSWLRLRSDNGVGGGGDDTLSSSSARL